MTNSKQYEKLCESVNIIPNKTVICDWCNKPMKYNPLNGWECMTPRCNREFDDVDLEQSDYSCILPEFTLEKFYALEELLANRIGYIGEYKKLSDNEWVFHYPFDIFPSRKDALCNLVIRLVDSGAITKEQVKEIIK